MQRGGQEEQTRCYHDTPVNDRILFTFGIPVHKEQDGEEKGKGYTPSVVIVFYFKKKKKEKKTMDANFDISDRR